MCDCDKVPLHVAHCRAGAYSTVPAKDIQEVKQEHQYSSMHSVMGRLTCDNEGACQVGMSWAARAH